MLKNDAPEFREGAPLPGFCPASDAILIALPALAPPARVSVSEIATRRKIKAGGAWQYWDNSVAPYMVEPMNATLSRRFESVVFVGPARSSKTEAMIINPWVHATLAHPRMTAIFHMTQGSAREFSVQDLGPIIRNTPELLERLRLDNVHDKCFSGTARVTVDWPVPNKLAGRSIDLVLMSDYDTAGFQDVGGEGSAFALGRKRHTHAGTRGMNVAESSPRFPILDEHWQPKTPHEAPPCEGIISLYNTGTRARLYWTCPDCGGEFEPTFNRIEFQKEGTPAERGATAHMSCLHCGSVIEPRQKAEINRGARWLHESGSGELVPLDGDVRKTTTASYWLHGPAAALSAWSQIVTRYLEGMETLESTGDESALKSATNLDLGLPYKPRAMSDGAAITESVLRENATDHIWQVCPAETCFLLAAVDVQGGRFVVQIMAHLGDGERVVVDRFDLHTPPQSAPRATDRQIDPAKYGEDWDALIALADLSYPVSNAEHRLKILSIVTDAGGSPGVTPNAYAFYRKMRKIHPRRFHLIRGVGGPNAKRAEVKTPETAHQGRRKVAKDIMLIRAGTDALKDEVAASLNRVDAGTRAIHIPAGAPADIFAEFAAERRGPKGWVMRPGVKRNEALDLAVYDLALAIVLGVEKINNRRPPAWAVIGPHNSFAVIEFVDDQDQPDPAAKPKKRRKPRSKKRFDGW